MKQEAQKHKQLGKSLGRQKIRVDRVLFDPDSVWARGCFGSEKQVELLFTVRLIPRTGELCVAYDNNTLCDSVYFELLTGNLQLVTERMNQKCMLEYGNNINSLIETLFVNQIENIVA